MDFVWCERVAGPCPECVWECRTTFCLMVECGGPEKLSCLIWPGFLLLGLITFFKIASSTCFSQSGPNLLKFPEPPQSTPLAHGQHLTCERVISHSIHWDGRGRYAFPRLCGGQSIPIVPFSIRLLGLVKQLSDSSSPPSPQSLIHRAEKVGRGRFLPLPQASVDQMKYHM